MRLSPTVIPDLRDGYVEVVRAVLRDGRRREARGFGALDVRDASFTVENTRAVIPHGVGRASLNEDIAYGEALLLCAGVASPSLLSAIAPAFRRFMDGGSLAGAYGPHVRHQLEHVVTTFRNDPDTRQAVVRVHPGAHEVVGLRDVPCTLFLGFELEGSDRMHMRATMRSNDAWLGLAYDAFMFCQLGWTVANALGARLATYTHHAYSLHVYDRDLERAEALHEYEGGWHPEPDGFAGCGQHGYEHGRRRAEAVYEEDYDSSAFRYVPVTEGEQMFADRLRGYDRLRRAANFSK